MTVSPATEKALRAVGMVVLVAVLGWLADTNNLSFISNPYVLSFVAMTATALENMIHNQGNGALFGAVKVA